MIYNRKRFITFVVFSEKVLCELLKKSKLTFFESEIPEQFESLLETDIVFVICVIFQILVSHSCFIEQETQEKHCRRKQFKIVIHETFRDLLLDEFG